MNKMTMRHFHDFYFLEAMKAGIARYKSENPRNGFRRSVERLEADVETTFSLLSENMAKRIRLYIWAAALGEARHGHDQLDYAFDEIRTGERDDIYEMASTIEMSEDNIAMVEELFENNNWCGSYGGRNWADIVRAVRMYTEVTPATFIDHCVDLEHNNGNVFTKDTSGTDIQMDIRNNGKMQRFLDEKFRFDILNHDFSRKVGVTFKVNKLLTRYANVISPVTSSDIVVENEWLDEYDVEEGDDYLTLVPAESRIFCEHCQSYAPSQDCTWVDDMDVCSDCLSENYNRCNDCYSYVSNDETTWSGDDKPLCAECLEAYTLCDSCHCYEQSGTKAEDTDNWFCDDCGGDLEYCEDCKEWYEDIEDHAEQCQVCEKWYCDEHSHHVPLYEDAEGIFDNPVDLPAIHSTPYTLNISGEDFHGYKRNGIAILQRDGAWSLACINLNKWIGYKTTYEDCTNAATELLILMDWEGLTAQKWQAQKHEWDAVKSILTKHNIAY